MAFYYGKPEPEVYAEFALMNEFANYAGLYNTARACGDFKAARGALERLHLAIACAGFYAFSVSIEYTDESRRKIARVVMWNLDTDEVMKLWPRVPKHLEALARLRKG